MDAAVLDALEIGCYDLGCFDTHSILDAAVLDATVLDGTILDVVNTPYEGDFGCSLEVMNVGCWGFGCCVNWMLRSWMLDASILTRGGGGQVGATNPLAPPDTVCVCGGGGGRHCSPINRWLWVVGMPALQSRQRPLTRWEDGGRGRPTLRSRQPPLD